MNWDIVTTKALSTGIVVVFFASCIFLLRVLYGPKGRLCDPQWSRWNEQARSDPGKQAGGKNFSRAFRHYVERFFNGQEKNDFPLRLKLEHTARVQALAEEIIAAEPAFAAQLLANALQVAALFHDVGRFEQFARYQTFADEHSCNHGVLGARILRREGFLHAATPEMRRLVLTAVSQHNRFAVPKRLSDDARTVLLGLRDIDKLDVMRVLAQALMPGARYDSVVLLHLKDNPGSFSADIYVALKEGRVAQYRDMHFLNDFRLLLCTWLYDLNFSTSFAIVRRDRLLDPILEGLVGIPAVQHEARGIVERLF